MGKGTDSEAQFNAQITARTRRERLRLRQTQAGMAQMLGIPLDRYKKYEKRTPLPHYLVPRFCAIVQVSVSYLLTGRDEVVREPAA